jgi:hypothetical protein
MTMQMQTDESIGASGSGGQHAAQQSLAVPVLVCTIHSFVRTSTPPILFIPSVYHHHHHHHSLASCDPLIGTCYMVPGW